MAKLGGVEWDRHLEAIELKVNARGRADVEDNEFKRNGGGTEWDVRIGVLRIGNDRIWKDIELELNGGDWDGRIGVLRVVHGRIGVLRIGNVRIWEDIELELNGWGTDWDVQIGALRICNGRIGTPGWGMGVFGKT
ncbi:hypothetical protein JB92DRAFT_3103684 [Gautieria morchelliformis]|nr:hypothetical protein JB92DRAFT_3103684 [Gautieria morchelliformis]